MLSYSHATLSPSLPVILNEVKNLMELRTGSAKGLQDSSVAEFTLSEAEVLPLNDTIANNILRHLLVLAQLLLSLLLSILDAPAEKALPGQPFRRAVGCRRIPAFDTAAACVGARDNKFPS